MGKITVLYNNIEGDRNLRSGWGQSLLVSEEKDILFDTGPSVDDLVFNASKLEKDVLRINDLVISHDHRDHTGAMQGYVEKVKGKIKVYLTEDSAFLDSRLSGLPNVEAIEVRKIERVAERIYVFPAKNAFSKENAIVIDAASGLIVLSGCAHPGIFRICKNVRKEFGRDIHALIGGFHLERYPSLFVAMIGKSLKHCGIRQISAIHCTGKNATKILRGIFRERFIDLAGGGSFEY